MTSQRRNNIKEIVVIGIFLLVIVSGCIDHVDDDASINTICGTITVVDRQSVDGYVVEITVFHDDERNVTCWKLGNGLSCIPDHMLTPYFVTTENSDKHK